MNNSKKKVSILILALFLLMTLTGTALALEENYLLFKEIEGSLMCTDDCGMPLASCDNATSVQMREDIRNKLALGMSKDEILQSYIDIYGVSVLTYPPRQGFNITAWTIPFLGILGGGLVIYLTLDKWVLASEELDSEQEEEDIDPIELEAYDDIVSDEQKNYW
ncbi:MAG: cytochrome c-type biogenesis protein CcmH [Bacillota bacterium]|nr:cytochrome c-type biogenesis protein CcmH [Bacillota bacterium]